MVEENVENYFSTRLLLWRLRREIDDRSSFLKKVLKTGGII